MSEGIQVFCDICAKGVIVHKQSMYKCKKCGKQVCVVCFDRGLKQCLECANPILFQEKKMQEQERRKRELEESFQRKLKKLKR